MSAIIISEDVPNIDKFVATSRVYVFDFSKFSEIINSAVLNTPTVPAVSGLTIGTPAIISTALDGIPANKGVAVRISGGTRGSSYEVEVRCTVVDTTDVLVRRAIFNVK